MDMTERDAVRYEKESREFVNTGYFTNEDGMNSKMLPPVRVKRVVNKENSPG